MKNNSIIVLLLKSTQLSKNPVVVIYSLKQLQLKNSGNTHKDTSASKSENEAAKSPLNLLELKFLQTSNWIQLLNFPSILNQKLTYA